MKESVKPEKRLPGTNSLTVTVNNNTSPSSAPAAFAPTLTDGASWATTARSDEPTTDATNATTSRTPHARPNQPHRMR